jgi:hypothetical protein
MKKIILVGSLAAVTILMIISFSSAVSSSTEVERKESTLYGLRPRRAVGEKISNIIENIKAKFLGERVFWIPITFRNKESRTYIRESTIYDTGKCLTCYVCDSLYLETYCGKTCVSGITCDWSPRCEDK